MRKIVIIFFIFLCFVNYSFGFNNVILKKYGVLENSYYVISPSNANNKKLPLVIFLHGRYGILPEFYEGFIQHIVDNGNIVVYPVYQKMNTEEMQYTTNAYNSLTDCFKHIKNYDKDRVLYIGHSVGGGMAFNLAVLAKTKGGIPYPKGIFSIAGGFYIVGDKEKSQIEMLNLEILDDLKSILVIGDKDQFTKMENQLLIYNSLPEDIFKEILLFDSLPNAKADHYFVCSLTSYSPVVARLGLKTIGLESANINELDSKLWSLYDQFESYVFNISDNINLNAYDLYFSYGIGRN